MNISFKKIVLILTLLVAPNFAFSTESIELSIENDYLLSCEQNIKNSSVASPNILSLTPFFTIFDNKNMLLLHPKKVGKTYVSIYLQNKTQSFLINIKPQDNSNGFETIKKEDFEFIILDLPPTGEKLEIDPPPSIKEVK